MNTDPKALSITAHTATPALSAPAAHDLQPWPFLPDLSAGR